MPHYYLAESISKEPQITEKAALGIQAQLVMELQTAFKCTYYIVDMCMCVTKKKDQIRVYSAMVQSVHTSDTRLTTALFESFFL